MAVAVVLEFEGATLDQYDQMLQKIGYTPQGRGAPGGIFHWVAKTDGGIRITDVWESREIFERFAQENIGPSAQEAGIAVEPKITFYDVHNYLTAG